MTSHLTVSMLSCLAHAYVKEKCRGDPCDVHPSAAPPNVPNTDDGECGEDVENIFIRISTDNKGMNFYDFCRWIFDTMG